MVGNVFVCMTPVQAPGAPNPISGLGLRMSCLLPLRQSCTERKPGQKGTVIYVSSVSDPVIRRPGPVSALHHVLLPQSGCVSPLRHPVFIGILI